MRQVKYIKVADRLTQFILNNKIKCGQQFLPQHRIAKEYNVSRSCVQKAIDRIAESGLIERKPGKGIFVKDISKRKKLKNNIGLLLHSERRAMGMVDPDDNFVLAIIWGIEEELKKQNINFLLRRYGMGSDLKDMAVVVENMNIDGLLIDSEFPDECLKILNVLGLPMVMVDRISGISGIGSVAPNFYDYFYQICNQLIEDGVRDICLIYAGCHYYGKEISSSLEQLKNESRDVNIRTIDYLASYHVYNSNYDDTLIPSCIHNLIDNKALPEVFLCNCDWTALRILNTLKENNIAVPERVGIIGCLGLGLAERTTPPISTLSIDTKEIGRRAVQMLIDMVVNGCPGRIERVPFTFIERGTFLWKKKKE